MPLVQGGPPQWVWERTADKLSVEIAPSQSLDGHTVYQVICRCGLEILRLQFLTSDELKATADALNSALARSPWQ